MIFNQNHSNPHKNTYYYNILVKKSKRYLIKFSCSSQFFRKTI
jgi:hypothetical protein